MVATLPPIEEVDRLDTADLAGTLSRLFEPAPPLFERLARRRPFRSYERLLALAREEIARMSEPERAALLAAHPRIGARRETLSEASRREQGDPASAEVDRELERLNDEYERRFGFRFVVFVRGRSRAEVLEVLRRRLEAPREGELSVGIEELLAIAADRAGVR